MDVSTSAVSERLDAVFHPWNRSDAPGVVVGVSRAGRPLYRRAFGLASIEHATANTTSTRMRIGSTSKHMTAVAVLMLADEGKLSLDAPIRTYIPELAGPCGSPTLAQLLTHTGGIRDFFDITGIIFVNRGAATVAPVGLGLETSRRAIGTNFPPGERMVYSNAGYYLLSIAVQRAGGTGFEAFMRARVFEPLGMFDTASIRSDLEIVPGIATFHHPLPEGRYRRGIYPTDELLGSGAVVSTVDDMLLWADHIRRDRPVGGSRVWTRLLERPTYSSGEVGEYCNGLTRQSYRGVEVVHHAGATMGATCMLLMCPAYEVDIIVMANRMDCNSSDLAFRALDAVLGDGALGPADGPVAVDAMQRHLGSWYSPSSRKVYEFKAQGESVALTYMGNPSRIVREASSGRLKMALPGHGVVQIGEPTDRSLEISDCGHRESLERLADPPRDIAALARGLAGRYRCSEFGIDTEIEIVLEDGRLEVDLVPAYGRQRLQLRPLSEDVLHWTAAASSLVGIASSGIVSVERDGGAVRGLWFNAVRTRNLWCERL